MSPKSDYNLKTIYKVFLTGSNQKRNKTSKLEGFFCICTLKKSWIIISSAPPGKNNQI
jgi:hypothetical protein